MNHDTPSYQNRYQRSLQRRRLFSKLQLFAVPLVLLILAVPAYLLVKESREVNSTTIETTAETGLTKTGALATNTRQERIAPPVKTVSAPEELPANEPVEPAIDPLANLTPEAKKELVAGRLRKASEELSIEIERVRKLLVKKKAEVKVLEGKLSTAQALLDSQSVVPASEPASTVNVDESDEQPLLDELWLASLNPDEFVVQIATSTNLIALEDYAREIPSQEPKAIYPFQATSEGELVYGASIGVYSSRGQAIEKATSLSDSEDLNGAWVRQVKEISAQVNNVKAL